MLLVLTFCDSEFVSNRFREASRWMKKTQNLLASPNLREITNHGDVVYGIRKHS
jgi:hypothetical protein